MYKRVVFVKGKNYIFTLNGSKINIFDNNGNKVLITDDLKDVLTREAIGFIKDGIILPNIQSGKYSSFDDVSLEFENYLKHFEIADGIDRESLINSEAYKEALKEVSELFEAKLNPDEKKEVIKETIEVNLETLFKDNGITEYEVTPSKSVIMYFKDGVYHTINYSTGDNIYDIILSNIEIDKLSSRGDLDKAIASTLENETFNRFTENESISLSEATGMEKKIFDFLTSQGYKDIKGIRQQDASGMWIVEMASGPMLFNVIQNPDGTIQIKTSGEKSLDASGDVHVNGSEVISSSLENGINDELAYNQMVQIVAKFKTDDNALLNEDEVNLMEHYRNLGSYVSDEVSPRTLHLISEAMPHFEEVYHPIANNLSKAKQKVLTPPKKNNSAFVNTLLVSFCSGVFTSAFILLIIKMFS